MNYKKIIIAFVIIILVGILSIGTYIYLNREPKKIEQYYIDGKYYLKQESDTQLGVILNYKYWQVINNYEDYLDITLNNSEVMALLKDIVDINFFKDKSLIILEDSIYTIAGSGLKESKGYIGQISDIKIRNNTADITIARKQEDSMGMAGENQIVTYFIPIENKNIKEVNRKYKYPFNLAELIGFLIRILPIILLFYAIIKYIDSKKKIKTEKIDEKEKEEKSKKALKRFIGWIVASGILGFLIESVNITVRSMAAKPIIYLYPMEDTEVSVKLEYIDKITVSYPRYNAGWKVLAKQNGELLDLSTSKNLYSLYYESHNVYNFKMEKDGFIVKGEDVSTFLEEKLSILGLTEREAEEFIIYWLPKLEANKYNYIRFATLDEINSNMPLEINPNPDTIIRVLMTFKGLKKSIDIKEQKLVSPERTGFVAVEWGGTEIK